MFLLATVLGKGLDEIESMSSLQLHEWMAYHGIEPLGEQRADLRAGMIAAEIHNSSGFATQAKSAGDYMHFRDKSTTQERVPDPREVFRAAGVKMNKAGNHG